MDNIFVEPEKHSAEEEPCLCRLFLCVCGGGAESAHASQPGITIKCLVLTLTAHKHNAYSELCPTVFSETSCQVNIMRMEVLSVL